MTYEIELYFQAGGASAADLADALSARIVALDPGLGFADADLGTQVWSGYVGRTDRSDERAEVLLLELHCSPELLRAKIQDLLLDEAPDTRVAESDAFVKITLIGAYVDWAAVRTIWQAVDSLWPSIPYDETSGFDFGLDSVPGG
ncbi:hypothetical protein [Plantactinospora endophytica]|uniref:50S ribosomal protein L11 methyltransferase n=1 Tax=Plantactinospora endophytica TaxID=673535 RepID=A0ABQ4EDE6_9ACTN|nr:hypothetical protein [Plantactinospora endophytica]GIG92742.1 hypothetical protein Pen02_76780 [Plantactinospora endophytica]